MSVQSNGTGGLQSAAPVIEKEFIPFVGETTVSEWPLGDPTAIQAEYDIQKATIGYDTRVASLKMKTANGRSMLTIKYNVDSTGEITQEISDKTVVEELVAIDIVRDIAAAPYFALSTNPNYVTSDKVAKVRLACELGYSTDDITANFASGYQWASWTDGMKRLRWHYMHGQDAYFETAFILRKSSFGVRNSQVLASFTSINSVVIAPTFSTQMNNLVATLPTGEWLYKPPQAENLGKGRWRISQEWHWATRWSIVYGGTATGTD
jgi:hypothetical protein